MNLDEAIRITDPATCQEALYRYDPEERAAIENEARHIVAQALREKQNNGWISVKDRLPPDNKNILAWFSGSRKFNPQCQISWALKSEFGRIMYEDQFGTVTHWRPLPEPPKGD